MMKVLVYCILLVSLPSIAVPNKNEIIDAREKLKKWGMAYCLSDRYSGSLNIDSSVALDGYFQLGKHNSEDAYSAVRAYFKASLKKNTKTSILTEKENILMNCLDAYESNEYERIIKQQDKWIMD
ncbi:hypothetical protein AB1E22_18960 [Buttiauxella gaviniae]|uniref:Type VI secretion system (T6SS) amidase immunity protein Tai4 n=1 Tax=Buttiauxella gaviniae TaxID=82990 RepID=A0ABV3NYY3_9ENTR